MKVRSAWPGTSKGAKAPHMPPNEIRVCSIPHDSLNPYIASTNRELARLGLAFTRPARNPKEIRALLQPDLILHFHWPSLLYGGRTAADFTRKTAKFIDLLDQARSIGCRVVWTAHNVFPHENRFPELDHRAAQQFIRRCDHILVHCEAGRRALAATFQHLPATTIAPHLDYRREYPAPPSREEARAALDIPVADFVFLMFGMLRAYKNFPLAVSAFRAAGLPQARLVIAGAPLAGDDASWLSTLVEKGERIDLRVAQVAHEHVPVLFGAADVALFSYERILASGGVALAQGMGRAVIAPRIGCLPDMVPDNTGLLYEAGSQDQLSAAMRRIVDLDVDAMGRQGQAHISKQSAEVFAATVFGVYQALGRR